jgi:GntR family transcriptional regulator, arabinose operon transcriptional repressor
MAIAKKTATKHGEIRSALIRQLRSGHWKPGDRIPTEAELIERFGVSRITVARAVRDLEAEGLVERRRGAGTFVRGAGAPTQLSFGLLIPELGETEIFEPICQGMMQSPLARGCALVWGSALGQAAAKDAHAWDLCRQFVERRVSGVFFAPVELIASRDEVNARIAAALDAARIPVVLLDRGLARHPHPDRYDLVGIDNARAGYTVTEHLIGLGGRRIAFLGAEAGASTIDEREAGYREALYRAGLAIDRTLIRRMRPDDDHAIKDLMQSQRPDAIVCANDRTAGRLMHTLRRLRYRVPDDVRLVGIDDVGYAALLPVPLTTLRQPTSEIGDAALAVMRARVSRRDLPPRDTRLHGEIVIRESCGAQPRR